MFESLKHKRQMKIIKREQELQQATCNHKWAHLAKTYQYTDNGCDVDVDDLYVIKCKKCMLEKSYISKEITDGYVKFSSEGD